MIFIKNIDLKYFMVDNKSSNKIEDLINIKKILEEKVKEKLKEG
jgi:hypothetical protein